MRQELDYIYEIYKSGSFSKAAENLYMTQPALSMSIRKIETQIGMVLFDRKKRPLQLTEAGEIYIRAIEKMRHLEEDIQDELNDIRTLATGTLRIGGTHYINARILPPILTAFRNAYPGVEIQLAESSAATLSSMLESQTVDLILNCDEPYIEKFEHYPAFQDHILLAVPAKEPLNNALKNCRLTALDIQSGRHLTNAVAPIPWSLLKDLPLINLSKNNNLHDRVLKIFQQAGIIPHITLEISQLVTAYHLAESGFASTFTCDRIINAPTTGLYFYKLDTPQARRSFYMLLPHREYTPKAVRRFIKFFTAHI